MMDFMKLLQGLGGGAGAASYGSMSPAQQVASDVAGEGGAGAMAGGGMMPMMMGAQLLSGALGGNNQPQQKPVAPAPMGGNPFPNLAALQGVQQLQPFKAMA